MRFLRGVRVGAEAHPGSSPIVWRLNRNQFVLSIVLAFLQVIALEAAADRSIRTPTSRAETSAAESVDQTEKHRLVWVIGQDSED